MIKLNGIQIKEPHGWKVETFNLTKSGRLASGKMVMDLVAKKRKFYLSYKVIDHKEMKKILDIIDGNDMFFTIEYDDNDETKSATVYVGSLPRDLARKDSVWYWKNFEFNLIEQ